MTTGASIRVARSGDTDAVVAIVNEAYRVEAFFVAGDRTHARETGALVEAGEILVAEDAGVVLACVHVSVRDGRGYFGMLAVRPDAQGRGLGGQLIAEAERRAADAGAIAMDIKVVDLRTDLMPRYARLGYRVAGTEPYEHRPVLQPCHFVLMTKSLRDP